MSDVFQVTHLMREARGERVAGVGGGRVYDVGADGVLALKGSDAPGVHRDDAIEYSNFPKLFKVEGRAKLMKAVKTPPPPPGAPGGETAEVAGTPAAPVKPPATPSGIPDVPALDSLSIPNWLKWARDHGIALSAAEKKTSPKEALYDLISEKAQAKK